MDNNGQEYFYRPYNVTRTTLSELAAYRSALTLDWLAAEDSRQRDLAASFETEAPAARFISTDCATYPKPAPGKIGKLMLELLKNLEGDEGTLILELMQVLVRTKLLVETSGLEEEPDFEALVKTPGLMVGEPHSTFPKVVTVIWMLVTDPATTMKYGWCPVKQVNKYLGVAKPRDIAKHMKALEMTVSRVRFVMEEFIQSIAPVNMYQRKQNVLKTPKRGRTAKQGRLAKRPHPNPKLFRMDPVQQLMHPSPSLPPEETHPTPRGKTNGADLTDLLDPEFSQDTWMYRSTRMEQDDVACSGVHPTSRDIVRRIYAILPFFDKDHANTAFLHKYRATVHGMSEGDDPLDSEASFYAAALTPLVFLQQYRDTWCLLERFHRAIRLYQMSHPTGKRSALKILQNFRAVSHKVQVFVRELPGPSTRPRTTTYSDSEDEELHDKKDIKYLKELIKNLG